MSWFRSFLWVFHGFPLCFRCFLTVFCGFRCTNLVPLSQSPCFSGIFRSFSLFFDPFSGYFAVFHRVLVLSSVFSMFSAGFRCISITIAAANRPDCALRLPEAKRHRQSFHQHTQIWSTNTRVGTNFDTTFLGEFWVYRPLVSCIPEIKAFANRFPKLRSIYRVTIFLSLVFDPWFGRGRFATGSEPVYSRALFQSELVQNRSRRA